jgi:hypothetical protein
LSFHRLSKSFVNLIDEGSRIATPSPCFCDHSIHCARGAAYLIGQ